MHHQGPCMVLKKKNVHENLNLNPISLYNKVKMITERIFTFLQ